jgi:hypothetical protein
MDGAKLRDRCYGSRREECFERVEGHGARPAPSSPRSRCPEALPGFPRCAAVSCRAGVDMILEAPRELAAIERADVDCAIGHFPRSRVAAPVVLLSPPPRDPDRGNDRGDRTDPVPKRPHTSLRGQRVVPLIHHAATASIVSAFQRLRIVRAVSELYAPRALLHTRRRFQRSCARREERGAAISRAVEVFHHS